MISTNRNLLLVRTSDHRLGTMSPPIGLLYLASAVRRRCREPWEIRLLDLGLAGSGWKDRLSAMLDETRASVVGLSTMTCEAGLARKVIRAVRSHGGPAAREPLVVMGGPYPTSAPADALEACGDDLDGICVGEGERTFPDLLDRITEGPLSFADLAGGLDGWHGAGPFTRADAVDDLDSLSDPAWDLLPPLDRYAASGNWNGMLKGRPYMSVLTSRGCPYDCSYCHHFFGRRVRLRSAERVVAEILGLHEKHGVREIHIIDDIFNINLERAKAICDGIIASRAKIHIAFPNGIRGDLVDRELLEKLKQAGAYKINFGVETASPRLQKEIGKNLDLEKLRENVGLTRKLGLIPFGFFMLGFPGETMEEMKQTIEFAVSSEFLTAKFFQVIPYPGTALGDRWKGGASDRFARPGPDQFHFFSDRVTCSDLEPREINDLLVEAYRRFFSRPGRVLGLLRRHPRPLTALGDLWRLHASLLRYRLGRSRESDDNGSFIAGIPWG